MGGEWPLGHLMGSLVVVVVVARDWVGQVGERGKEVAQVWGLDWVHVNPVAN